MAYRYDYYDPEPAPTYYSAPLEPPPGRTYIYTPPGSPPPRNNFEYGTSPYGQPRYQEPQREYLPPPITVPTEPQGFHPELGSQYQFQYSQCTGKRKVHLFPHVLNVGFDNWNQLYWIEEPTEWMYQ